MTEQQAEREVLSRLGVHSVSGEWAGDRYVVKMRRYTNRATIAVDRAALEDVLDPWGLLWEHMCDLAAHLHYMPVIDHDPGDEDRA